MRGNHITLHRVLFVACLLAAFVIGGCSAALADLKLPTGPIGHYKPIEITRIRTAPVMALPERTPPPRSAGAVREVKVLSKAVSNTSVWDRLAQCESGGNWHTNTGNGYSGGLQWLPSTWSAARSGYNAGKPKEQQVHVQHAHNASREQQIAVAQHWLGRTSWAQWPACSRKLGLR